MNVNHTDFGYIVHSAINAFSNRWKSVLNYSACIRRSLRPSRCFHMLMPAQAIVSTMAVGTNVVGIYVGRKQCPHRSMQRFPCGGMQQCHRGRRQRCPCIDQQRCHFKGMQRHACLATGNYTNVLAHLCQVLVHVARGEVCGGWSKYVNVGVFMLAFTCAYMYLSYTT